MFLSSASIPASRAGEPKVIYLSIASSSSSSTFAQSILSSSMAGRGSGINSGQPLVEEGTVVSFVVGGGAAAGLIEVVLVVAAKPEEEEREEVCQSTAEESEENATESAARGARLAMVSATRRY